MIFGYFSGLLNPSITGGIVFYLAGLIMQRFKPKWPNMMYGYRTQSSLRSKETFDAANQFSAKLMKNLGIKLVIMGIVIAFFFHQTYWYAFIGSGILALLGATFYLISTTEKFLKKNFPN